VLRPAVLREIEHVCQRRQIDHAFLAQIIGVTEWKSSDVAASASEVTESPSIARPVYFRMKRWIDVIGSLVLMGIFSPILIIAGVLVLLDVGTPVLFWQERLGLRGRSFLIYKFRTLGAPFDFKGRSSPSGRKPSTIGQFLRATRIDELPQLLNVLFGEMSLIGPRPLLPEDQPKDPSRRLSVRPGMTGWAQVNGAKLVSKDEKDGLDAWYIRNASLWVDLRIVFMTLKVLLRNHVSSEEALADAEQVRGKNAHFQRGCTTAAE